MNIFICKCLFYLISMFLSSSTVFHYKDILYLTNPLSLNTSVVSNFFHYKQYLKTDTFITKTFTHIFISCGMRYLLHQSLHMRRSLFIKIYGNEIHAFSSVLIRNLLLRFNSASLQFTYIIPLAPCMHNHLYTVQL